MTAAEPLPPSPEFLPVPQYPIDSVDNALRVLWLVGERTSLRLTDVSVYLGVASSTAHRVLAMLQFRGFVIQNPSTRAYEAGPALDRIAFSVLRRLDARERARPVLERLAAVTGETVHLGRLEDSDVHFIDSIESTRAVRVGSRLGRSLPAHCTSTGKALLAGLSRDRLLVLYPDEDLDQLTAQSLSTRSALFEQLAVIEQRGYAASRGESEEGVSSLAVPIEGRAAAPLAINVSVPTSRMSATVRKQILAALRSAAAQVAELTG